MYIYKLAFISRIVRYALVTCNPINPSYQKLFLDACGVNMVVTGQSCLVHNKQSTSHK